MHLVDVVDWSTCSATAGTYLELINGKRTEVGCGGGGGGLCGRISIPITSKITKLNSVGAHFFRIETKHLRLAEVDQSKFLGLNRKKTDQVFQ